MSVKILWRLTVLAAITFVLFARSGPRAGAQATPTEGYRLVDVWTSRQPASSVAAFRRAAGIDLAPDGTIYAVDEADRRLYRLDDRGRVSGAWSTVSSFAPRDVAASAERVFLAGTNQVEVRSRDGALLRTLAMQGVSGLGDGPDGHFYVARRTGGDLQTATTIEVLSRDGDTVASWPATPFIIMAPRGVTVGADGRVYLAADGAVYVFANGGVIAGLRVPDGTPDGDVVDVAVDDQGRLFGVQGGGGGARRILVWDLASRQGVGRAAVSGAQAVAIGPGAGLLVSVYIQNGFTGLTCFADRSSLGDEPQRWGDFDQSLGQLVGPRRLAAARTGDVYLLDRREVVQRWSLAGDPLEMWPRGGTNYLVDVIGGGDQPCIVTNRTVACLGAGQSVVWSASPSAESWLTAAAGNDSRLLAIDLVEQRVWGYARDGSPAPGWSLAPPAGFAAVADVAVDGTTVYLADRTAGLIRVVDLAGASRPPIELQVTGEAVRLAARDGMVYALTREGWVWKFTAAGTLQAVWQPSADSVPADIAVGPGARVYLADTQQDRILVFEPGGSPSGTVPVEPDLRCNVAVEKRALPDEVLVGEPVRVTLSVKGTCPVGDGRLDIVLAIDQSGSMAGSPLAAAQAAAVSFLGQLDPNKTQVAVIGFSTSAQVLQGLTGNLREVARAIARLSAGGQTNYTDALDAAISELIGPTGRPEVPQSVVLLTDGKPTDRTQVLRAVDDLRDLGVSLYTIGLGANVDADLLATMASDPAQYFEAPTEADLAEVYGAIARRVIATRLLGDATVTDSLPSDMDLVPGSDVPPARVDGRTLTWSLSEVPTTGRALSYQVRPRQDGLRETNVFAVLDYVDAAGASGEVFFPIPVIRVLPKTHWEAYFPQVWRNRCRPLRTDVVLVMDVSSSMTEPDRAGSSRTKMDAAVGAARIFLNAMTFPEDQAAIVTFDANARRLQPLTSSRAELELALASIQTGFGTRIDKGLELAVVDLLGARHDPRNNPVIIVLTDGLPEAGSESRLLSVARDARAAGFTLFTVGFGENADPDLLYLVAGDASRTFMAPDGEELRAIYAAIAGWILCE